MEKDLQIEKNIGSFWDKNSNLFKLLTLFIVAILLSVIGWNFYRSINTVFSGTNYMALPSNIYITKEIPGRRFLKKLSGQKTMQQDTIPVGSFLITILGKSVYTLSDLTDLKREFNKDSVIALTVIRSTSVKSFLILTSKKSCIKYADSFIVSKKDLPPEFYRILKDGILIGGINQDGATARAGVKIGDVLLTIKDKVIEVDKGEMSQNLSPESLRFLRSHSPGESVPYRILRKNEELIINVHLGTFGFQIDTLIITFYGLPFIGLGLFFILKRGNLFSARITGMAFVVMGFSISSGYSVNKPDFDLFTKVLIYVSGLAFILFLPMMFHSLTYFPREIQLITKDKWKAIAPYCFSICIMIVYTSWYFIDFTTMNYTLIIGMNLLNVIFYILLRKIGSRELSKEKKKVGRFIIVALSIYLGFYVFIFLMEIFHLRIFMKEAESGFPLALVIPVAYLYTTWKYRLLDINLRVKRNIQYVVFTIFWKTLLIFAFILGFYAFALIHINFPNIKLSATNIEFLSHPLGRDQNLVYEKIAIIIISIFYTFFLIKIGRKGQNFIDKKFYREKFDYRFAQSKLAKLLESKLTIESLSEILVEKISELMHLQSAGIALFKNENIWNEKIYFYDRIKHSRIYFSPDEAVIKSFRELKGSFGIEYLPGELKNYLQTFKIITLLPIKTNDTNRGILFIGGKLSEVPLKHEDLEFLDSILSNISVTIENAVLYEELAIQERMKHELNLARNIQIASLPQEVPKMKGLDIYAESIPALEVGGDFYDFLNGSPDDITIIIGDVSGKGTSSALYMLKIQGILQTLHEFNLSPKSLFMRANRLLYRHIVSKSYITAMGANFKIKEKILTVARAGHLPIYFYNSFENKIIKIRPDGIGIGLSEENVFNVSIHEETINFNCGDIFLFISDGIIDARNNSSEQFGEERLENLLIANNSLTSQEICDIIIKKAQEFSGRENQFDDMTIVSVKINNL